MFIHHVKIYTEEKKFIPGAIQIGDGIITGVFPEENKPELRSAKRKAEEQKEEVIDGQGAYAIPGLIDLHLHGCMGADFCDGTIDAIAKMAEYEASVGVTAIVPATMTLPVKELEHILQVAAAYQKEKQPPERADLLGINMEGPFISPAKKGAQDEKNILPCDVKLCERFLKLSDGLVKYVGIAPEESTNALEFINKMKDRVSLTLAHTNADYDQAKAAFDAGADHATHLYNAMSAFSHRTPGVVGAVFDSPHVMAEMICDGVHVHPAVVRATLKMLGADRLILISDSMRATGMPDGQYTLGGLDVNVAGNHATLVSDGALAGSVTNLMDCMRIAVKNMKIPLETAVACVTINPAKSLGVYDRYGSLTPGKRADVVLLDPNLDVMAVVKEGTRIR